MDDINVALDYSRPADLLGAAQAKTEFYSAVYPLLGVGDGAAMIFSYYQYVHEIGEPQHAFMKQYSQLRAEALKRPGIV